MNESLWTTDKMFEVTLKEPDDFLKVRETLSRIGVSPEKKKNFISLVIYCTSKVNTILFTLKSCSHLMAKNITLQRTI